MKSLRIVMVIIGMVAFSISAFAAEFQTIGFMAASMGGAGVASSRDSHAIYYNPALLAYETNKVEISLSAGVGLREINLADHIQTLSDIDIEETFDEIEGLIPTLEQTDLDALMASGTLPVGSPTLKADVTTIKEELLAIAEVNGLQLMPEASLAARFGHFGAGIFLISEATAIGTIDSDRIDFIFTRDIPGHGTAYVEFDETYGTGGALVVRDEATYNAASLEAAINEPTTYLTLTGIVYTEVPVGYGHSFNIPTGELAIGGAFKLIQGITYSSVIDIDSDADDIEDGLEASEKTSSSYGIDLGMLYSPSFFRNFSIGIVGKNLNKPEFEAKIGDDIAIDPQVRAGAAIHLFDGKITLACDMDLTVNETYVEKYDSQYIGGGISFAPVSFFSVRGGVMKNIQESVEGSVLTGGLAFGIKWLQLDLSGQYSTETGEYDDQEIPRYGKVKLSIVSKWK